MTEREFVNLQQALVWLFSPWLTLFLSIGLGASVMTAVFLMFARVARWLTRTGG